MAPKTFRLDTVCVDLIDTLEGSRRTFRKDPDAAEGSFKKTVTEMLERVIADYQEVLGEGDYAEALREHVLETFLPRYTHLAIDHNQVEEQGYRTWRHGDPVFRLVAFFGALGFSMFAMRTFHHPLTALTLPLVLILPLLPEIKGWIYRRRYTRLLQQVVDDMGRLQGALDARALPGPGTE